MMASPTIISIIVYLIGIFFIAWFFSRNEGISAYIINKRKTGLWTLTFANVATIIGGGAVVPIVAEVYRTGISFGIALPISFMIGMVVMGIVARQIKKMGDEYQAETVVDFFAKRYDTRNRNVALVLQLFTLLMWVGIQAIAVTSLAVALTGAAYWIALVFGALVTLAYTSFGGLKIDIITDFVQFWIMMIVFTIMGIVGWQYSGGISRVLSEVPASHLDLFAFGGPQWFIGVIIVSGFIYLGNGAHWQRILSAQTPSIARKSFYLSLPFMALFSGVVLFFGLLSVVTLGDVTPETAVFTLMSTMLHPVLAGVGYAAMLAVIMSSVDSFIVGGSTIVYKALHPYVEGASEDPRALKRARLITLVFGMFGFLVAFIVPNIVTLGLFTTYLALIFVPPILAGLYSRRISAQASLCSLIVPTVALLAVYPFLQENSFLVSTALGVACILLYDKIYPRFLKVPQA